MLKFQPAFKEMVLDASHYWERMRIPYNIVLVTLAITCWGRDMLDHGIVGMVGGIIVLLFFAMAANICFCAAYAVDLVLQLTPIRRHRVYPRWVLFVSGTTFASAIALYLLLGDGMG